ncbi:hypothetical protein [Mycobacterium sp.]|uniref:hypothetical protein n=1 Tax=Mycobacterium sp. TaxID=1785 RepID=UPI0031D9EA9A
MLDWPTLAELRTADYSYFGQLAGYLEKISSQAQTALQDLAQDVKRPGGVDWEGEAGDAAIAQAHADLIKARPIMWSWDDVAVSARRWQDGLQAGTCAALDAVDDAQRDGFTVNQDYSVSDTRRSATEAQFAQRVAAAEAHSNYIRYHVGALVANESRMNAELKTMTAQWGTLTFPQSGGGVKAQPADRTFKQGPDQPPPPGLKDPSEGRLPDPVGKLGLPNYNPGSLSDEDARAVYAHGELRMRVLNEQLVKQGLNAEERAKKMFEQRNSLRSWVRDLMRDRTAADWLAENRPNQTWEQSIQKEISRGKQGDTIYEGIIESSTRSNPGVNAATGINPEHPPALPAVHPSAPIESMHTESHPPTPPAPETVHSPAAPPVKSAQVEPPAPRALPPAEGGGEGPMLPGAPGQPFGPQVIPPPHAHPHWLGETPEEEWEEGPAGQH